MKPETRSFYAHAVQNIVDRVVQHLDEALDLETLAASACLSPFHFHRVFRGMVGETPLELSRRLRLERAAWQLATTDRSVTEVAFDAGYDTHEAFTRAFRSHYSASPSKFRDRKHRRIELAAPCGVHFDSKRAPGTVTPFIARDSGGKDMKVEIRQKPEMRAAAVRHVGPYNQIPIAFEKLGAIAGPSGLLQYASGQMIALYYDDPESTPQDQLRSDAAIVVPDGIALPAGLSEHRVPAGTYACTVHEGGYERLGDVWARFMGEWLPASGHRLREAVSYEVYLNNPMTVAKQADLRTELCMPLES